ncbi:MAG: hypothetical protein WCO84_08085, partial [bacterium]
HASHFGHTTNSMRVYVTKEILVELAKMFAEASTAKYPPPYCCAAKLVDLDSPGTAGSSDEAVIDKAAQATEILNVPQTADEAASFRRYLMDHPGDAKAIEGLRVWDEAHPKENECG